MEAEKCVAVTDGDRRNRIVGNRAVFTSSTSRSITGIRVDIDRKNKAIDVFLTWSTLASLNIHVD